MAATLTPPLPACGEKVRVRGEPTHPWLNTIVFVALMS